MSIITFCFSKDASPYSSNEICKGREPDRESHIFVNMARFSDVALLSESFNAIDDHNNGSDNATALQVLHIRPKTRGGNDGDTGQYSVFGMDSKSIAAINSW